MKFKDFQDSVYMSTNIDLQKNYTVYKHAKTQATQELISVYRSICKPFAYLELIGKFLLVKAHILKAPKKSEEIFVEYHSILQKESKDQVESNVIPLKKDI